MEDDIDKSRYCFNHYLFSNIKKNNDASDIGEVLATIAE